MVPSLNKILAAAFFFITTLVLSQSDVSGIYNPKDYKNDEQFRNFNKRRQAVSRWQINELKNGALMVRLSSNRKTIEILRKNKQEDLATQKEQETFAINKGIVRAFSKYYNFSKVYFFYSHSSDTLLKGAREGIFLDTNLSIDPNIKFTEKFYLIAEKDYAYSSAIGFVPEDSAKHTFETGTAAKEMGVVTKNKYGHQLKEPFPYAVVAKGSAMAETVVYIQFVKPGETVPASEVAALAKVKVSISKKYSFEKYSGYIQNYNEGLQKFYSANKGFTTNDPEMKPFLY